MADAALTFSYASPLAGGHHVIRFLTGDTFASTPLLSDEEYFYLLAQTPDPARCAARACRAIAAKLSQEADLMIAGELSIKLSQRAIAFVARGKELDAEATLSGGKPYAGGLSWSEKDDAAIDTDLVPSAFRRHPDPDRPAWSALDAL